jgi:long-chain fatty acid transport protein
MKKSSGKMKKIFKITVILLAAALLMSPSAFATNGDNLIGIGPISRAMGGVGVASPQDAISAIFANPAAMCFGPYCPGSEATFAGTYFSPTVKSKLNFSGFGMGKASETSQMNPFIAPAIGITSPITDKLRFGVGAYGLSGMGVDYKDTDPLYQNLYTQYQIMKFAPNLAYLITPDLSVGASVSIDYANLDLGTGGSHGYTLGFQLGALYHIGMFNLGLSYITPQEVNHKRVFDFDGNGTLDDLKLESPNTVMFGVSMTPSYNWLIEFNARWYNWADATGYDDFDWDNQLVFAIGAQYRPITPLAIRAGFNYGKSPVNEHNGFNPMGTTNVQGMNVSNVNYEVFRVVGFPAIAETHMTFGVGYDLTTALVINLSYVHAFENTLSQTSAYNLASMESSMSQDTVSLGLTWRF